MEALDETVVLSVVVPLYNEAASLVHLHESLVPVVSDATKGNFEILYCNDGSTDETASIVRKLHDDDARVKLLSLSRNFGKELTLAAGIAKAKGQAIILLDGDGQHPVDRIPDFIAAWNTGAKVVIGIDNDYERQGFIKSLGSRLFYSLYNRMTGEMAVQGASDFRLIDRSVQQEIIKFKEPDRITRGLIDWVGFKRAYVHFQTRTRIGGEATYSIRKLTRLASHSFVSMSPVPLYIFGYLGIVITSFALLLGVSVIAEQLLLSDPLKWRFTGTAMLSILVLFLVGLLLMSQGIIALYISHIHNLAKQRPLYIIDSKESCGIDK
jgi:glycosyltransferase involved in cell wall biosynthesis